MFFSAHVLAVEQQVVWWVRRGEDSACGPRLHLSGSPQAEWKQIQTVSSYISWQLTQSSPPSVLSGVGLLGLETKPEEGGLFFFFLLDMNCILIDL